QAITTLLGGRHSLISAQGRTLPSDRCSRIDPPSRVWNSSRSTSTPSSLNSFTTREYRSSGHHLPMPSVKSSKARSREMRTVTACRIGSTALMASERYLACAILAGVTADRDWTAKFDRTFAAKPGAEGSVQSRIWMEVLGDEYPVELSPHSYITRTELERFARELELGPADLFADLACGEGGPGLWIARMTGARLVGLDISKVALESAARTSAAMGLADRCRWVEGSF